MTNPSQQITKHPALCYAQDLQDICEPLKKLNITYFGHANIDNSGKFSAINNNPALLHNYLTKQYYNADLHNAKSALLSDNYVIWDAVEQSGLSAEMYAEGGEFGARHIFTIIEKTPHGNDYFHFANHLKDNSINQVYIANIDLLKLFILFFKEKIRQSKTLLHAYDLKFGIDQESAGYSIKNNEEQVQQKVARQLFLQNIKLNKTIDVNMEKPLSFREIEILAWLHYGKTANDIARILGTSECTVSKHISNIKTKTQCYTQFQLGEFFSRLFHNSSEIIDLFLQSKNSGI